MGFDREKKAGLSRIDRSKKGSIDARIMPLIEKINSMSDYYTTSSCAGRIVLLAVPGSRKKKDAGWIYSSHKPAKADDITACLKKLPKADVWLKQEGMILHVCCRTISSAGWLLSKANDAGLKRSGIYSISRRIILEIMGNELMDTIVAKAGMVIASEGYVRIAVQEANRRMRLNRKRMARFLGLLS